MSLNQYQSTSVTVSLRLLEKTLADVERLLLAPSGGVLFQTQRDISQGNSAQLLALIKQAREEIGVLARFFGLAREDVSAAQSVKAMLSRAWADLEDTRPSTLRRYGPVAPELASTLEPGVQRLIELVSAMMALLQPTDLQCCRPQGSSE